MASRVSFALLSGYDWACMRTPWPVLDARIDRDEVEALVKDDPYFTNGLVLGLHWRLSFCRTRSITVSARFVPLRPLRPLRCVWTQKQKALEVFRPFAFGLSRSPPTSFVIGTSCWDLPCDELWRL